MGREVAWISRADISSLNSRRCAAGNPLDLWIGGLDEGDGPHILDRGQLGHLLCLALMVGEVLELD